MKSYFFLPKCNMRGNIRAHIKKNTKEEERKKQREREQKRTVAREEVGGPSSSRSRWCCPSSRLFSKRENERGKEQSSAYIMRGFRAFFLLCVCCKKKKKRKR